MGARLTQRILVFCMIMSASLAFVFLIAKHYEIDGIKTRAAAKSAINAAIIAGNQFGFMQSCEGQGDFLAIAFDIYVCTNRSNSLVYDEIYLTYPASAGGRERIYTFLDRGDRDSADLLLRNVFDIERYDPVTVRDPPTWEEDPLGERYWRFIFYSLRHTRHLLAAALETGEGRYYDKLREIVESFLDSGMDKPHAWDDYHGVAFRTMTLVNTWWKLRQSGELPDGLSDKILFGLERHGDFLLDPTHFERDNNHGITEASALLVLAASFPDLPNAPAWRSTAIRRIDESLRDVVDEDGVLKENSPYYHFYVLEKYWEILAYAKEHDVEISSEFEGTLSRMVDHAAYVLQPDGDMPLLGASIPRRIERSGEFRLMAEENPLFEYALTSGRSGKRPPQKYIFYPSSGIAIFRSGWGERRPYADETQVVFDTGPYRTDHSDLDIMTFSAYAEGARIIREGGLFTYEVEHPLYNYFHGTRAHNTVVVDGKDQARDEGTSQGLVTGDSWAFVSAEHDAYPGVRHSRTLALFEEGAILVVDALASPSSHTYEQLFHLPPEATINAQTAEEVSGSVSTDGQNIPFTIKQLAGAPQLTVWKGEEASARGLCAVAYEVLRPCYELSYETRGAATSYVTLILLGEKGQSYQARLEGDTLFLDTGTSLYRANITFPRENVFGTGYVDLDVQEEAYAAKWWDRFLDALGRSIKW